MHISIKTNFNLPTFSTCIINYSTCISKRALQIIWTERNIEKKRNNRRPL